MADIGIIGGGMAGLHLGLSLQARGIQPTLYAERTPEQQRARRLSNVVSRNASTRARERRLGVNHWDSPPHDMGRLSVRVSGPAPLAFQGTMEPAQSVDMRIYWARLLEDFSTRGGRIAVGAVEVRDLEGLAARHDLLVVASGRASLTHVFPRVEAHSPYTAPQRLTLGGLYRGIRYAEPPALEVFVSPGDGEILVLPVQSFEPGLTGMGIFIVTGGRFEPLRHLKYDVDPRAFDAAILGLLRDHAPAVYDRVDAAGFGLSRPEDHCHVAITPTVRRGYATLASDRRVLALGDVHIVMDPLTGQGANNASHAAEVACEAICSATAFDQAFFDRVERAICQYAIPVSDTCNMRLGAPPPHFRQLLGAAAGSQSVADFYADGYNHPDRFGAIAGSAEATAAFLSTAKTAVTIL